MFGNPFYNLHSSYYDPADNYDHARHLLDQRRALAQQQALKQEYAQHLRDEYDSDEDVNWAYRDALEQRRAYERRQQEEKIINERRKEQEALEQLAREQEEERQESIQRARRHEEALERIVREQEEAFREFLRKTRRQMAQNCPDQPPPPSRPQSPDHQIQTSSESSASLQRSPSPTPAAESASREDRSQEHNEASETIFRVQDALLTLHNLAAEFDTLRKSFTFPTVIDFQAPQSIVSVTVPPSLPTITSDTDSPKLAYNQTNYALHSYIESLNRLLIKLDGVESWGRDSVRKTRRSLVGDVEKEANRLETYWKQAWAAHVADTEQ